MAIIDLPDLVSIVKNMMGASYNAVSDDGFDRACQHALDELNWTLPCSHSKKGYWITERARRHVIYVLLVESAHKFRFKEIHLHNRFAHYHKLIMLMDEEFAKALEDDIELFDVGRYPDVAYYLSPGFQYDYYGRDATYHRWR